MPVRITDVGRWLGQTLGYGLDVLLPPGCNACGGELPGRGEQPLFCPACRDEFVAQPEAACLRCAAPVPAVVGPLPDCPRCRKRDYRFASVLAMGIYRGSCGTPWCG